MISTFHAFLTLLAKDLRIELRTKEMMTSMGLYALLVLTIYGAALSQTADGFDVLQVSPALIWALLVFTSLLGLNRLFLREQTTGCLQALLLAPIERSAIFFSKMVSHIIFLVIIEAITTLLFFLLFLGKLAWSAHLLLIVCPLMVGAVGMAGLGTLLATVSMHARSRDVLLAILFVPLIFPLLYTQVSAVGILLWGWEIQPIIFWRSLGLGITYDVIMVTLAWLLYDAVLGV